MNSKAKNPHSLLFTLALVSTAAAILLHGYLTHRHFEVTLGQITGSSLCNISSTFNCDTVAASSYSSFLGIPLALWGLVTNLMLFLMAFSVRATWTGSPSALSRWTVRLSSGVFLASIVMAFISVTQLKIYCPFCIVTYFLSVLTFAGLASLGVTQMASNILDDITSLFSTSNIYFTCSTWPKCSSNITINEII